MTEPEARTNKPAQMVKQTPVQLVIAGHPYMRIGTPASTGPYARLRGNHVQWLEQGAAAWDLVIGRRVPVRTAARILGMSATTTWRRACWFEDWIALPRFYGFTPGPVPHQRGTRAVPNGRPISLPMDAEYVLQQILDAGFTLQDVVASRRAVPVCVRDLAAARTGCEAN